MRRLIRLGVLGVALALVGVGPTFGALVMRIPAQGGTGAIPPGGGDGNPPAPTPSPEAEPAAILSVLPNGPPGLRRLGDTLAVTITFDRPVVLASGAVTLTLGGVERQAPLTAGSGTAALTFAVAVAEGDHAPGGFGVRGPIAGALTQPLGGPVASGFPATLFADRPVDGRRPSVTGVSTPSAGRRERGEPIEVTLRFDRPVTVTGTPTLPLAFASGGVAAAYVSGSGTTDLSFRYLVAWGDSAAGFTLGPALAGAIADAASGNPARVDVAGSSELVVDGLLARFPYTADAVRSFTVPPGIRRVRVKAWGAGGAAGSNSAAARGGAGAFVLSEIDVPADRVLLIATARATRDLDSTAGGGGGASYVLRSDGTPVAWAAGGGGGSASLAWASHGGAGGCEAGQNGNSFVGAANANSCSLAFQSRGGTGGTQTGAGTGGTGRVAGGNGVGSSGGWGNLDRVYCAGGPPGASALTYSDGGWPFGGSGVNSAVANGGAGGGGGYFGGGGGGAYGWHDAGGGGGGSSFWLTACLPGAGSGPPASGETVDAPPGNTATGRPVAAGGHPFPGSRLGGDGYVALRLIP